MIKPWLGETPAEQLRLVRVTAYTFRAQVANNWRDRNVFILGDAAHLTPPFVGQGMAAGLRDALNLSWKVAGVLGKSLPESVLDTYQQERKAHAAAMILMAVSMGAAMTGGGRLGDLIRKVVFPRLETLRLPGTRTSAADGVAPGLRRSAMVVKSRTPGQLAGTLCPNPVLRDGLHFDQVVGNRFALVTSSPLSAAQQKELKSRGAAVVSVAPDSELGRWLKQGRATAAIVRPDGAVMQAGRNIEAICDAVPAFSVGHSDVAESEDTMTELLVLNDGKQEMQAVSLDGTRVRTLITGIDERADGIVVDQLRGHVYWTNMGAPDPGSGPRSEEAYARNGSLERADLDGTNRVTIVPRGAFTTGKQLAADFEAGVLYWCDREGMQVLSCNLDGSGLRPLVVPAVGDQAAHTISNHPVGIASIWIGACCIGRRRVHQKPARAGSFAPPSIFRQASARSTATTSNCCGRICPSPSICTCSVGRRWCGPTGAQNPRATRSTARWCSRPSAHPRSFLADTTRRSASPQSPSPSST